ncbi:glutamate-1-semialdehyde 2,1-aminomutase [Aquirufa antheringensis]|uniref:glutamate-1-semialdehyde 2,1-aminomutase n=1 Tax=Aquirufa antheringensis TaxID=2516559 RepID=UPI0022A8DBC5|nr:glutamate-1-semialdehyde 2,1-aminomutase [Aquirufa antheringensis]MCZ2484749.1 glutamate-1-semialdehyde 2,1-aminomutase [Aquirufa antheringensis]
MKDEYSKKLHDLIPGGAHTYSRGDDQFPSNTPSIFVRGEGAYIFDVKDEKYLDYGMGLRSVNIGYGNREIADAAYNEIINGNNLTRASITELKAAELFVDLIPSVEMVKFAKHGSTVTTAALKLARAYTGRKFIAVPFEQPFFSFDDWFIGSTIIKLGTLEEASNYTLKFNYNNIESLKKLFLEYPNQIAAVMLEPATIQSPCSNNCSPENNTCNGCPNIEDNFLHQVREVTKLNGSLMILDEMITGFRWNLNGAQKKYNILPDLCTFGKAMANGFAVAALGGKREVMKLGGIEEPGSERIFLTSTTHGAEMSALGAFIKTVEIIKRDDVIEHYWNYGKELMQGMNKVAQELGINENFYVEGYPCSPSYVTKDNTGNVSMSFRTLFAQEMVKSRILMPYIAISFAHKEKELTITLEAVIKALKVYKNALVNGIEHYLESEIIKPVFRQFN